MLQPIHIYTDGAALGNPGPGGYGLVMLYMGHRKEMAQGFRLTTNNRMELLAVIVALEQIKKEGHEVVIFTDSQYVSNALNQGWIYGWIKKGFKNVKNPDLWLRFIPLWKKWKPKFVWVKGHAGVKENERCDVLATSAARMSDLSIDEGYETEAANIFDDK